MSLSGKGMQKLLNICKTFSRIHGITFNVHKTICTVFESRQTFKIFKYPTLYLNGLAVDYMDHHKYLGVFLSSINDGKDIKRQLRSYISKANLLVQMFGKCSDEVKIQLYSSYCTSMCCIHRYTSMV